MKRGEIGEIVGRTTRIHEADAAERTRLRLPDERRDPRYAAPLDGASSARRAHATHAT
jgi:hypothetical protein